jgi:hypothetical protein
MNIIGKNIGIRQRSGAAPNILFSMPVWIHRVTPKISISRTAKTEKKPPAINDKNRLFGNNIGKFFFRKIQATPRRQAIEEMIRTVNIEY